MAPSPIVFADRFEALLYEDRDGWFLYFYEIFVPDDGSVSRELTYLRVLEIPDGSSHSLLDAIEKFLKEKGVEDVVAV